MKSSHIIEVEGDLLTQPVEAIVNAWNRNIIPWWLLLPQGVSGAIKKKAGFAPFKELAKHGAIPLGGAVLTGAGRLPYKGIIHVAGINMLWRATPYSIEQSIHSAMKIVHDQQFASVAFPLIGAGTGGFDTQRVKKIMLQALSHCPTQAQVFIVTYRKNLKNASLKPAHLKNGDI